MKTNTETIVLASKETGLEENADKQGSGENYIMK